MCVLAATLGLRLPGSPSFEVMRKTYRLPRSEYCTFVLIHTQNTEKVKKRKKMCFSPFLRKEYMNNCKAIRQAGAQAGRNSEKARFVDAGVKIAYGCPYEMPLKMDAHGSCPC